MSRAPLISLATTRRVREFGVNAEPWPLPFPT